MCIRTHIIEHLHKNPEYLINNLVADRKGIKSEKGISSAFLKAIGQGCEAVVIDLDMRMRDKPLKTIKLSGKIYNRRFDFEEGRIKECYVIYHDRAVLIDATMFVPNDEDASREFIKGMLDRLL